MFKNTEKRHHGYFGFMLLFPLAGFILAAGVLLFFKDFIMSRYAAESHCLMSFSIMSSRLLL
jgi:hypothetical protein